MNRPLLRDLLLTVALLLPGWARADSVGVGVGLAQDLPDAFETPVPARFGPGVALLVPARLDLTAAAALRATFRAELAFGRDHVSWIAGGGPLVGEETKARVLGTSVVIGPEVHLPTEGKVVPYLAGGLGLALVHTFHNVERPELFEEKDPEVLDNSMYLDPFTRQVALATDVAVGVDLGDLLWAELGYGASFLDATPMRRSDPTLDVQRQAYGWNALRLAVGLTFPLGG